MCTSLFLRAFHAMSMPQGFRKRSFSAFLRFCSYLPMDATGFCYFIALWLLLVSIWFAKRCLIGLCRKLCFLKLMGRVICNVSRETTCYNIDNAVCGQNIAKGMLLRRKNGGLVSRETFMAWRDMLATVLSALRW